MWRPMTAPRPDVDLDALERQHRVRSRFTSDGKACKEKDCKLGPDLHLHPICDADGQVWPCSTSQVVAELRTLRARDEAAADVRALAEALVALADAAEEVSAWGAGGKTLRRMRTMGETNAALLDYAPAIATARAILAEPEA